MLLLRKFKSEEGVMANINPLLTTEYRKFVTNLNSEALFSFYKKKDDQETLTMVTPSLVKLTQAITPVNDSQPTEEGAKDKYVRVTVFQGDTPVPTNENKPTGDFLRIIDITTIFPKTEAALVTTAQGYKKLQRLGLTKNNDPALTAQIIGTLGDYRFRVLKDQLQYGLRTDKFHEKEENREVS